MDIVTMLNLIISTNQGVSSQEPEIRVKDMGSLCELNKNILTTRLSSPISPDCCFLTPVLKKKLFFESSGKFYQDFQG